MQKDNKIDTISGVLKDKTILLLILDGWGMSPSWSGNAISFSDPKFFNTLWRLYPHAVLQAFKGLADDKGRVGNSEIGHASIGNGRIIRQDLTEINEAIKKGYFFKNQSLLEACKHIKKFKSNLHIIGLVSDGAVHSDIDHLFALLKLAKLQNINNLYLHLITDGVDTSDRSAIEYIHKLQYYIEKNKIGKIASIIGRFYAMDKGGHIDRIEKAYLLQTQGKGKIFTDSVKALQFYYSKGIFDSDIPPTVISNDQKTKFINNYDGIIFFNFRSDRARSLTKAYTDKKYFKSVLGRRYKLLKDLYFVTLTSYMLAKKIPVHIAFPAQVINDGLSALLSKAGLKQLHIAETEKYAHVTYFFNGGNEQQFSGEDRVIVPSPEVKSYDLKPAMSTEKITQVILKALKSKKYQFIVANIANIDMVAHTGNILATAKAVKFTDKMIGKITKANQNGITIITADHGNAEQMIPYKSASTRATFHTTNPVPFIIIKKGKERNLMEKAIQPTHIPMHEIISSKYNLADIAPTILELFGIPKSKEMTGHSLLKIIGYK